MAKKLFPLNSIILIVAFAAQFLTGFGKAIYFREK
jgi:hypothetical protein